MEHVKTRFLNFDGLRGLAILSVVLCHYFYTYFHDTNNVLFMDKFFSFAFKYGFLGVQLFFIISGFVISFTLYRYKNLYSFALARFSRLYPIYWCSMLLIFILAFLGGKNYDLNLYVKSLTMAPMLLGREHLIGPYWTLEFELVFYVIAAFIFYIGAFSRHFMFITWLLLFVCWKNFQDIHFFSSHNLIKYECTLLFSYAPLFIFGIYLYKLVNDGYKKMHLLMLLISTIAYLVLYEGAPHTDLSNFTIRCWLVFIFTISFYAIVSPKSKFLSNKYLVFCGKISYSWYLTHFAAGFLMIQILSVYFPYNAAILVTFFASLILAYLFYKFLELPLHHGFLSKGQALLEKARRGQASRRAGYESGY